MNSKAFESKLAKLANEASKNERGKNEKGGETMTRLIDADGLCEEFKKRHRAALRWKEQAILDNDEERIIRADATLAFLSEVKLTIDNAPTFVNEYTKGFADGERSGRNFSLTDEEKAILIRQWQPQGEWIEEAVPVALIGRGNRQRRCSLCGHGDIQAKTQKVPYCWFCGAKMKEVDNDK